MNKRFLKVQEVAEYLSIGRQTVYNLASQKKIPYIKFNHSIRFDIDDIESIIKKGRVETIENGTKF